jgi:hypothetical protein
MEAAMFNNEADLFFCNPRTAPKFPDWFGNLYLLRRDIDQCMGVDPTSGSAGQPTCLWPGAMATMAGFDLLAKFYAGDDAVGKVSARFLSFLKRFCPTLQATERETVYQLRNSLLHSFGLYSESKPNKIYRFQLTNSGGTLISHEPPERYRVDLQILHQVSRILS